MGKIIYILILIYLSSCTKESSENKDTSKTSVNPDYKERVEVLVGVTDTKQLPIVFENGSGLSADLCDLLNKNQDKYFFKSIVCPTKRLRELARRGQVHLAAFQNLKWSWRDQTDQRSITLLKDKDVFITLKKDGLSQDVFKFGKANSIALVRDFHYSFLKTQENALPLIMKVKDESAVVEVVTNGQAEFGAVSQALVDYIKVKDSGRYQNLYISDSFDSEYERYYVITKSSPIKADELNTFLEALKNSGALEKLFHLYGINVPK